MNRIEIKAALAVDDAGLITGVAWPFGTPDRVGDMIEKGAFATAAVPLPMLFGHDPLQPVGAWTGVAETDEGFVVKGKLTLSVNRAREVRDLVHDGAVGGLSIGFETRKAAPRRGGGRTITDLDLVEISLVSVPCHPRARITGAKSAAEAFALADAINRAAAAFRL
jgi:HK97 family phage prohead protease